jgi:hypothetical protein
VKTTLLISAVLLGALASGIVLAPGVTLAGDDDCKVPMAQWQPREAVEQMARARGWTVGRIKIDDGCYEIRGQDESGRTIEVKVDPASLTVIRVKQKSGKHDGDRDEGSRNRRGEQSGRGAAPAPTGAPPPNGLFQGAAPKVEVQ